MTDWTPGGAADGSDGMDAVAHNGQDARTLVAAGRHADHGGSAENGRLLLR
ncbi:hypothetical protein [Rubripirellula obstinata]|uniref:hypothetical protein n=1 Tax=Rubripirellula obstinata TaxID=406547 RepID=UPI0012FBE75F|nr:hypothetical protein [Rubripirellula obstinata]